MLAWAIISTLLLGVSVWLNYRTIKQNLELNDQREELVDQIEESLDALDGNYASLAHAASMEVFSDEPVIQDVVRNLRAAKNAVLAVASKIATYSPETTDGKTVE